MATLAMEVLLDHDDDDIDHVHDEDDDLSVLHAEPVLLEKGCNSSTPISVETYCEDRDLSYAIMASLSSCSGAGTRNNKRAIDDDGDDYDDIQVICSRTKRMLYLGESSNSKPESVTVVDDDRVEDDIFLCDMCVDRKPKIEKFCSKACSHPYCADCMAKYVASKLKENFPNISCPASRCKGRLEPQDCRSIVPSEVFERWADALSQAMLLPSEILYCPYKDCSAPLVDERSGKSEPITNSECPHCRRMFCAGCRVPWHAEISCEEFQKLKKDEREMEDAKVMNPAKEEDEWEICPSCRSFAEKTQEGCSYISCRCGLFFVCD